MPVSNDVISRWNVSVPNLSTSSLAFFAAVEDELKAKRLLFRPSAFSLVRAACSLRDGRICEFRTNVSYLISELLRREGLLFSWWLGRRIPDFGELMGCLALIAIPVLLYICFKAAGIFGGVVLFVFVVCGLFIYLQQGGKIGDVDIEDLMLSVSVVGSVYLRFFRPITNFSDTRRMFEETVHRVVTMWWREYSPSTT